MFAILKMVIGKMGIIWSTQKMPCPESVKRLLSQFTEHLDDYNSRSYNETQVRVEFIDPFFEALEWDIYNRLGSAEAYKDVVHGDTIRVGERAKSPDYCFRIGGQRKFFLEAKKPSINLKDDEGPAFQLRRYGWSAKLSLSILTNFKEFAIYDCREKPSKTDKSSKARILYLKYTDYEKNWDDLSNLFSPTAIRKGSFDRYAHSTKNKKGTAEVDETFLQEIETWRELLARNIALRNPNISQQQLNLAVQQTIDRIIFLRICEDRGIEPYGQLQNLQKGEKIYSRLCDVFRYADDRYNSGLFYFGQEKGRTEEPDKLTLTLTIDDKILKTIFKSLYYPDSPYEFSVLTADILGQVYEQFLGKVIQLSKNGRASIEDKPSIKKAGGVFYTPTFIVDYIVKNTIEKLTLGKTPRQVAKIRILDPACGSGSFLIKAYQYLLDWHLGFYLQHGFEKYKKELARVNNNEFRLTIQERKRILLKNIFGVDIDAQAIEVTKLSLLLKALEGESEESISVQLKFIHERALPDLSKNIKCGNSLIDSEFYKSQIDILNDDVRKKINPFNWGNEFSEIINDGGFDAIIGNPPYIRIQTLKESSPLEVEFISNNYSSATKGNYDLYVIFIEKGIQLLKEKGILGYIVPNKFISTQYGESLRGLLSSKQLPSQIVNFGDIQIFKSATIYTCIIFLEKTKHSKVIINTVTDINAWINENTSESCTLELTSLSKSPWNLFSSELGDIFDSLKKCHSTLQSLSEKIFQGLITGSDSVFLLENKGNGIYFSVETKKEYHFEKEIIHPLCKGSVNLRRYGISQPKKSIIFPYHIEGHRAILLSPLELRTQYPVLWNYLIECKKKLEGRERGKWKNDRWYSFGRSQNLTKMNQSKILTPCIANQSSFSLDWDEHYFFIGSGGGGGGGYGITLKNKRKENYLFVLGQLNSMLLNLYLKSISSPFSGGYFACNRQYIKQLPLYDLENCPTHLRKKSERLIMLTEACLHLTKSILTDSITQHEISLLQRQRNSTELECDEIVCELFELSPTQTKVILNSSISRKSY